MPPPVVQILLVAGLATACASTVARSPESGSPRRIFRDVPFADRDAGPLLADVVVPNPTEHAAPHPAVLVLHPGGWTSGSKRLVADEIRRLAAAGFVGVAPSYRLAPGSRFPAQIEDVADAVRWLRRNAADFDVDPNRIGMLGYSSGAHLAALMGTSAPAGARIQAIAVGGTPADLIGLGPTPMTRALLGGGQESRFDAYVQASPARQVGGTEPPFFIQHGRFDFLIPRAQSRTLRDALRARGVPVEYEEPWLGHLGIFLLQDSGVGRTLDFFDHWLRDPAALAQTEARARGVGVIEARRPLARADG